MASSLRQFVAAVSISAPLAGLLACGADVVGPTNATTTTTTTTTSQPATYTGSLVRASRATRAVCLLAYPHLPSASGNILPTAMVTGIGSMDAIFDAFASGQRLEMKVTFVAGTQYYEGDIAEVQVLQVSDPQPASIVNEADSFFPWNDAIAINVGGYQQVLLTPDTVFLPDSEIASLKALKELMPPSTSSRLCVQGNGLRMGDWYTKLAATVRLWHPAANTSCPY